MPIRYEGISTYRQNAQTHLLLGLLRRETCLGSIILLATSAYSSGVLLSQSVHHPAVSLERPSSLPSRTLPFCPSTFRSSMRFRPELGLSSNQHGCQCQIPPHAFAYRGWVQHCTRGRRY